MSKLNLTDEMIEEILRILDKGNDVELKKVRGEIVVVSISRKRIK